jgi:uncharacterized protein YacL
MSRKIPEVPRRSSSWDSRAASAGEDKSMQWPAGRASRIAWDYWAVRAFLIACTAGVSYTLGPFGLRGLPAAGVGFLIAMLVLLAELRLRRAALSGLLAGAFGAVLGIFAALLVTLVISRTDEPEPTKSFLEFASLFAFGYLGLVVGSGRSEKLRADAFSELFEKRAGPAESVKLLDTSVLIDGRIADICDAQFLDGVLGVPQFVLRELQMVADSSDGLKRQRGRRGLEVLQRMQKMPGVDVRVLGDSVQAGDVDHKLVELARRMDAKIVTNDFNLNKVATVHGLSVLNVNQLANALKTAVLPGEPLRVLIAREGKEASQGVAYLNDGTMVVVDGARRMINKSVDVTVTSVHQTTAGKMIFGRMEERAKQSAPLLRQAAAAGSGEGVGGVRVDAAGRVEDGGRQPERPSPDRQRDAIFPPLDGN